MDFKVIIAITFIVSAIISGLDRFSWSKLRQVKLEEAKQKKKNIDFEIAENILKKPEWIQYSDSLFVISCVVTVVWLMLPNFELILVVALAVSLIITLVEKFHLEKKKKQALDELYRRNANPHEKEVEKTTLMPWWIDYGWSFFPLLLLIVALRSFVYEPFKIPSGSMKPTLLVHDFILVNKFAYGLRLPVTKTKLTQGDAPQRGDVVVFRAPHEPEKDYIKRLIGLPGDKVFYKPDQTIWIEPNCSSSTKQQESELAGLKCGVPNLISKTLVESQGLDGLDIHKQNLAGIEHEILIDSRYVGKDFYSKERQLRFSIMYPNASMLERRRFFSGPEGSSYIEDWKNGVLVPENEYFVMGDNRNNSSDARYWGFVPEQMMVGKAEAVWLHLEFDLAESGPLSWIPTSVDFDRVGGIQ